ncbi:MAG: type II toxin-antitoxin system VapC family toxin [Candidatus Obscuribacterales bacterium]|nr:type II toxin-antitoxin system VapC family toxin [Candidatus Obscuribacterales bacterium]
MITAVDSSILIDIFIDDKDFGKSSASQLRRCLSDGAVIACGVVLVETMPLFPSGDHLLKILEAMKIRPVTVSLESFVEAGRAWTAYRQSGGPRNRIAADFLIGAHALKEADRLLTRDRGFYRKYFKRLDVVGG